MDVCFYWIDGRSFWFYVEFLCGDVKWFNCYCVSIWFDWYGVFRFVGLYYY